MEPPHNKRFTLLQANRKFRPNPKEKSTLEKEPVSLARRLPDWAALYLNDPDDPEPNPLRRINKLLKLLDTFSMERELQSVREMQKVGEVVVDIIRKSMARGADGVASSGEEVLKNFDGRGCAGGDRGGKHGKDGKAKGRGRDPSGARTGKGSSIGGGKTPSSRAGSQYLRGRGRSTSSRPPPLHPSSPWGGDVATTSAAVTGEAASPVTAAEVVANCLSPMSLASLTPSRDKSSRRRNEFLKCPSPNLMKICACGPDKQHSTCLVWEGNSWGQQGRVC